MKKCLICVVSFGSRPDVVVVIIYELLSTFVAKFCAAAEPLFECILENPVGSTQYNNLTFPPLYSGTISIKGTFANVFEIRFLFNSHYYYVSKFKMYANDERLRAHSNGIGNDGQR